MTTMYLILPVILFVITLIIILVLRAEDKKSRSLQIVKDRIQAFRSETQQTMARMNETAKDAGEHVDSKIKEAVDMIAGIDSSLERLSRHRNDLSALESICRGYETALDRLRVQTEHAEERIGVVQAEVEKASRIDDVVKDFENRVAAVHGEMDLLSQSFNDLVARSRDDLEQVAREHESAARQMRSQFVDDLSANREDFGTYMDEVRSDMDRRQDELKSYVDTSRDELDRHGQDARNLVDESVDRLTQEKEGLGSFVEESRTSLENLRKELETFRTEIGKSLEDERTRLEEEKQTSLDDASSTYARLAGDLSDSGAAMKAEIDDVKTSVEEALSAQRDSMDAFLESIRTDMASFDERKAVLEKQADLLADKAAGVFDDFSTRINELSTSSQNAFSALMVEGENNLTGLSKELASRFEEDTASQFSRLDEARSLLESVHDRQKELMDKEVEDYSSRIRDELAEAMDAETRRVSGVFDSMIAAGTEQLGNFAKKLTEIREAVSMLNQGVNESLGRATEKLAQIQSRLTASEASLNDTQSKVTTAKEELFNIQREHKALLDEVGKARKELEWLQAKAQDARRDRQNEEARLVKLQMEDGRKAEGSVRKTEVSSDEFVGAEEDIPLDDE